MANRSTAQRRSGPRPDLAKLLERARLWAGLTPEQARDLLGLSRARYVRWWESGRTTPSEATLERIVEAYTATPGYMDAYVGTWADDEDAPPPPDVLIEQLVLARRKRKRNSKRVAGFAGSTLVSLALSVCGFSPHGGCHTLRVPQRTPRTVLVRRYTGRRKRPTWPGLKLP